MCSDHASSDRKRGKEVLLDCWHTMPIIFNEALLNAAQGMHIVSNTMGTPMKYGGAWQGRLTLLLGPPGSGKSVLLKALAGKLRNDPRL